jgi:hypothetical protein
MFLKTKNILSLLAITTKSVDEITKNLVKPEFYFEKYVLKAKNLFENV